MTEEKVFFDNNKDYDHEEAKKLLVEVKDFFQNRLKIIVLEETAPGKAMGKTENKSVLEAFYIEKTEQQPIYAACNGYGDLKQIFDLFEDRLGDLLTEVENVLDNNTELDEASKDNLESYLVAVNKCLKVFRNKRKRNKMEELSTVDELREELQQLFGNMIVEYIIGLIDGIYERIRNGASPIHEIVLRELNCFLRCNGIYTQQVFEGEKMEPEFMEPTADSAENYTEDFNLFETIDEIRRYPYFFTDGTKIVDGQARIWRRKD